MAYFVVAVVALGASALTFFSGFGLGTLLLPAFLLIFPGEIAVSATAIVHLLNNLFKLGLIGRHARGGLVIRFGVPAAIAALVGAWLLTRLVDLPVLGRYTIGSRECEVSLLKIVLGALIAVFGLAELLPTGGRWTFGARWIPLGGALSGFFGGLSGHQGALRSAFLIKAGLSKEAFIATGVCCAVLVDFSRLAVYGTTFFSRHFEALGQSDGLPILAVAVAAAFVGAFVGARLMKKVTLVTVQRMVGGLLIVMAAAFVSGLL